MHALGVRVTYGSWRLCSFAHRSEERENEATGTWEIMVRWGKCAGQVSLLCLGDSQQVTARIKRLNDHPEQLFSNLSVCRSRAGRGWGGELVKTPVAGVQPQRFLLSRFWMRPENLHFKQVLKWGWCYQSGGCTLRNTGLTPPSHFTGE